MNEKSPIRVLHVLTAMNMAGTETLLMNLYRFIDRKIIQFDFAVSSKEKCAYDEEITRMGGYIYHYPLYTGRNHRKYKKWWNSFFLQHSEYHIVHGHIGSTAAIYLNIAKKHGIYTIAHSHSIRNPNYTFHSVMYRLFSYRTRFIADYFMGCSKQAIIDRYGKKIQQNECKSHVLNNAIDLQKYIPNHETRERIRQELSISNEEVVIGTVGRLSLVKNPDEILRISDRLRNEGYSFRFIWVGDGELKEDISRKIKQLKLNQYIELIGLRKDVNDVLQAMDLFIFPSVFEGLGIACVEAQAAGLPTICSDTIPVESHVTHICYPEPLNNTDAWVEKIKELYQVVVTPGYSKPDTSIDIKAAGFDIRDTSKWLQDFYVSIIDKKYNALIT